MIALLKQTYPNNFKKVIGSLITLSCTNVRAPETLTEWFHDTTVQAGQSQHKSQIPAHHGITLKHDQEDIMMLPVLSIPGHSG